MIERITKIVCGIFNLYEKHGAEDYIGEPVSQIEHMSQAAQLAEKAGYEDEVILAAFFHDIGHFCLSEQETQKMEGFGTMRHEQIGANYLRKKGFSEKIARLVENHVQAKRYLTFKNLDYYANLSEASKKTLEFQGGRMNEAEALTFEKDELFELSIQMRYWDELAKEVNIPLTDLDTLKEKTLKHLQKHTFKSSS